MPQFLLTALFLLAASQTSRAGLVAPRQPTPFAKPQPDPVRGWSPNPTRGPEFVFGSLSNDQLFGRQNTQLTDPHICGWISGLSESPLSCPDGPSTSSDCGYLVQSGSPYNVWCCPYTQSGPSLYADYAGCPWITTCLPYSDPNNLNTGSQITRDVASAVISCPSEIPECTTIFLQGPSTETYYQYGCGTVATTISAFQSYSVDEVVTSSAGPSSTAPSSTASSSSSTTSTSTTTTSTSTSPSSSSSSSTNVGAIAGGVIGGVAALAIVGGVIAWLIYKKKAARRPVMREVSTYTGSSAYQPSTMGGSRSFGGAEIISLAPSMTRH